jgi:chorismate mutase/prephenate dehydratase
MTEARDLPALRAAVTQIDQELLRLFGERMDLTRSIAAFKAENGLAIHDPKREDEIVSQAVERVAPQDALRAEILLRSMFRLSRGAQYEQLLPGVGSFDLGSQIAAAAGGLDGISRVVFQGSAGSYADLACQKLFPAVPATRTETWEAACQMVENGGADLAVLPLDNSTAGTVDAVYDLLLRYDLQIWRSLSLTIEHCLLGAPGSKIKDIRSVISHPQALAQCSGLIRERGWQVRESLNTAFAAAAVAGSAEPGLAAIASADAAAANGLDILATSISNTRVNQTRFIAVGSSPRITADADRISLVLRVPHRSGSLAAALAVFGDRGLNLNKIQSRPDPESPWTYLFYLDFECPYQEPLPALATLWQLSQEMPLLRFLGWYREEG